MIQFFESFISYLNITYESAWKIMFIMEIINTTIAFSKKYMKDTPKSRAFAIYFVDWYLWYLIQKS